MALSTKGVLASATLSFLLLTALAVPSSARDVSASFSVSFFYVAEGVLFLGQAGGENALGVAPTVACAAESATGLENPWDGVACYDVGSLQGWTYDCTVHESQDLISPILVRRPVMYSVLATTSPVHTDGSIMAIGQRVTGDIWFNLLQIAVPQVAVDTEFPIQILPYDSGTENLPCRTTL